MDDAREEAGAPLAGGRTITGGDVGEHLGGAVRGVGTATLDLASGDLVRLAPGVAHGFESVGVAFSIHYGRGSNPMTDVVRVPELADLFRASDR